MRSKKMLMQVREAINVQVQPNYGNQTKPNLVHFLKEQRHCPDQQYKNTWRTIEDN